MNYRCTFCIHHSNQPIMMISIFRMKYSIYRATVGLFILYYVHLYLIFFSSFFVYLVPLFPLRPVHFFLLYFSSCFSWHVYLFILHPVRFYLLCFSSLCLYLVPLLFAFTPLITGDWVERFEVFIFALFGILCLTIVMEGFCDQL